jgi:hypothetical protein
MSDQIQYLGFSAQAGGREYRFRVAGESERLFTLWIAAAGFAPGRLRFQEGPDISFRKLQSLLAGEAGNPLAPRHILSDSEVDDYAASRPGAAKKRF